MEEAVAEAEASADSDNAGAAIWPDARSSATLRTWSRMRTSRLSFRRCSTSGRSCDAYVHCWRTKMASKETKRKIREEVRADQARYDDVTRRLKERIERGRRDEAQRSERRESS